MSKTPKNLINKVLIFLGKTCDETKWHPIETAPNSPYYKLDKQLPDYPLDVR